MNVVLNCFPAEAVALAACADALPVLGIVGGNHRCNGSSVSVDRAHPEVVLMRLIMLSSMSEFAAANGFAASSSSSSSSIPPCMSSRRVVRAFAASLLALWQGLQPALEHSIATLASFDFHEDINVAGGGDVGEENSDPSVHDTPMDTTAPATHSSSSSASLKAAKTARAVEMNTKHRELESTVDCLLSLRLLVAALCAGDCGERPPDTSTSAAATMAAGHGSSDNSVIASLDGVVSELDRLMLTIVVGPTAFDGGVGIGTCGETTSRRSAQSAVNNNNNPATSGIPFTRTANFRCGQYLALAIWDHTRITRMLPPNTNTNDSDETAIPVPRSEEITSSLTTNRTQSQLAAAHTMFSVKEISPAAVGIFASTILQPLSSITLCSQDQKLGKLLRSALPMLVRGASFSQPQLSLWALGKLVVLGLIFYEQHWEFVHEEIWVLGGSQLVSYLAAAYPSAFVDAVLLPALRLHNKFKETKELLGFLFGHLKLYAPDNDNINDSRLLSYLLLPHNSTITF